MIYFKGGKYVLCTHKISYTDASGKVTKYVGEEGADWWREFEKAWPEIKIEKIEEVKPTVEQLERFKDIEKYAIKGGFASEVADYVEKGIYPEKDDAKVLTELKLNKENEELKEKLETVDKTVADLMLLVGTLGGEA